MSADHCSDADLEQARQAIYRADELIQGVLSDRSELICASDVNLLVELAEDVRKGISQLTDEIKKALVGCG